MTQPLDALMAVIDRDVNVTGLRHNMSRVSYFLDHSPSPAQFKSALQGLNTALHTDLRSALAQLEGLLTGQSSPLTALSYHLTAVAVLTTPGGQLTTMNAALSVYSQAADTAFANG